MIKIFTVCCLSLLVYFFRCTTDIAGTISETDSGCAIAGIVYDTWGMPACGARVILHDQSNVSPVLIVKLQNGKLLHRSDTAQTDQSGRFNLDSIDTGNYIIEISHMDSLGVNIAAAVGLSDTIIEKQGSVKPTGCIAGKVDTLDFASQGSKYVVVRELGRVIPVDSSGNFIIINLPQWKYHLSIAIDSVITLNSGDTMPVAVSSGDTTTVNGVGSVSGMTVAYDTIQFENISFNTDSGIGGGVAFLKTDSSLDVRLLIGRKDYYHQVDIQIDNYKADSTQIKTSGFTQVTPAENTHLSTVKNGSLLLLYSIKKDISGFSYKVNADTTSISGTIVLAGIPDISSYSPVRITGSFTADIGGIGVTEWDCNYGDTICSCWFLE